MGRSLFLSILVSLFLFPGLGLSADTEALEEERVQEVVDRSRADRVAIEKDLNKRDIASISNQEKEWAKEYDQLMDEESEADWFEKIDEITE